MMVLVENPAVMAAQVVNRTEDQVQFGVDRLEPAAHARVRRIKPRVNGIEPRVNGIEPRINRIEPGINGGKARVNGGKPAVRATIRTSEPTVYPFAQGGDRHARAADHSIVEMPGRCRG
jgi:hypothetical protein